MATQLAARASVQLKTAAFDPLRTSRRASRPAAPRRATGASCRSAGGRSARHVGALRARPARIGVPAGDSARAAGALGCGSASRALRSRLPCLARAAVAKAGRDASDASEEAERRCATPAAEALHARSASDSCAVTRLRLPRGHAPATPHGARSAAQQRSLAAGAHFRARSGADVRLARVLLPQSRLGGHGCPAGQLADSFRAAGDAG